MTLVMHMEFELILKTNFVSFGMHIIQTKYLAKYLYILSFLSNLKMRRRGTYLSMRGRYLDHFHYLHFCQGGKLCKTWEIIVSVHAKSPMMQRFHKKEKKYLILYFF
jgi:hypothetical protein